MAPWRGQLLLCCVLAFLLPHTLGNVMNEAKISRHLLQAESLANAGGVWHYNDAAAPMVDDKSIRMARQMEMADAGSDAPSEAEEAAEANADYEDHKKVTAEIVKRITEPFKDRNPVYFLLEGFMVCGVVILGFWVSERLWLKQNLSLASFWDPEIDKRMYPLF
ncbi:hypothetical protein GUITHDRAFT_102814 [Guillardia theta CCMP2712]|uniref:Uncharacterized protein n=1 Tax=Guillardia theta (strain CCMP2712) TaxID=905079 RepID=L1JSK8_GUITC|nr:hypothetical protein GUITHDRAFT_102814 [Guillardia theta CCMP2712]EKX51551.1 hypothetical protein GUITHDRAFT_102814 [Guillardia theta CCMP2712]|mmetsp:Transcript_23764/g.77370  ORF Transcript_23764/g.77370 Transcript_23764/m.77370 type:complete len:164 (-) Transcript_23764:1917-2408(-)|eukprot:XP_005838531.1 hypothetical protein GUITHDRAFT_102814 [Guillardia theta CCMP2712]